MKKQHLLIYPYLIAIFVFLPLINSLQISGSVVSNVTVIGNVTNATIPSGGGSTPQIPKNETISEEKPIKDGFPYWILIISGIVLIVLWAILIDRERNGRRK